MTASNHKKMLKQLKTKPAKIQRFHKYNSPKERSCSILKRRCRFTGRVGRGLIRKYGINVCRQSFREIAHKIGFKKYS
ncbi:MAG: 30S ribosomal protein S14 [Candidatus Woesearchaeota archaeon]